ncbi:hypothetical protein DIPPA_20337, partial [Diplonema papillatum]
MYRLGVQSVALMLIVLLVAMLTVLFGAVSLSTSVAAVNDARSVGDEAVESCVQGGQQNVMSITSFYLRSTLKEATSAVDAFLLSHEEPMLVLYNYVRVFDPDTTTNPGWISSTLRPQLAAVYKQVVGKGSTVVAYAPYPFSKNSVEGAWGGAMAFTGIAAFPLPPGRVLVGESRDPTFTKFQDNNLTSFAVGYADEMGVLDTRNGTATGCNMWDPAFNPYTDVVGICPIPSEMWLDENWHLVLDRTINNAQDPDESVPLNEPDAIHYSPVVGAGTSLVMLLSTTWTHPDMVNRYPRQNNRVGWLMFGIDTKTIQDAIVAQRIPDGSVLYLVQANMWTDETGELIACSRGTVVGTKPNSTVLRPLHVTEHADPLVAAHGRHVLQGGVAGQYSGAVDLTEQEDFMTWEHEAQLYLWGASAVLRTGGTKLFAVVAMPRERILDDLDSIMRPVQEGMRQARRREDGKFTTNMIVLFASVVGAAVVAVCAAFMATKILTGPLLDLEKDMANVAVMRLENVDLTRPMSKLREVNHMEASFRAMVSNLVEYRNFLPQAVLVDESDNMEAESIDIETSASALYLAPASDKSKSSVISVDASDTRGQMVSLRKRQFSVVFFNILSWHRAAFSSDELPAAHADVLVKLLQAVQGSKGISDTFLGDRLLASFNAIVPVSAFRQAAVQAAVTARRSVTSHEHALKLSFGVATGEGRVGTMGVATMKKVTIMSTVVPWVCALERINKQNETTGLVDGSTARDVEQWFTLRCIGKAMYPKRARQPIVVYEVMGTAHTTNQEWMYQLQERETANPYTFCNNAWELVFKGEFDAAAAHMKAYTGKKDAVKVLSEKTTHGGVSEEQKGMKWSREAAVEWVKQATGLQVPSAFHFRPDNGRLRPIIRLAGDAGASADAYLRSLLGALGGEEPPSGTAQWVLAWLACASAPTATPADFEELVRSVSPAHHEGPSPRLPGRSADAAHSDSADYAAFSAAAAAAAAHASSTAATSAAAAAADPSAASSSAAAPRTPSGIPLPGTPEGDEEVARALQVDVQDTPARRVTFAERPDDIRRLESQVERLTAMVLALVERSSPPAPQRPSVQRGMEVPPPPPLVDASRVPFGSHHAGAGHTPAPFSAPQPPAPVPAPTQPSQPAQENPFAGQHFSAPSQTEVFQQDPLDALERGSVQSQPALITPGPGLLDPRVWLSYGPVEKSLLLVHIRDIFAEVLNGSQALANDGQHLLHHLSCILHLMDDTSDQEGMVRLAESTLHRMVVLKTALKAGWSVAADLQKGYHEEDEVPAYLRRGFQAMRKADEQPAKPASPPSSGGRGTRRQQEERVSVSVLDRFPPPPRATSGGRALLLEPPLSNGERERLVGKANSYIGDALALSTRRGVHSVYRRFLEFRRHWETRFGTPLDVPTAVVLFVTRLLSREPNSISTSTAVQYVVNIQSAERRLGRPIESQLVRDFIRSLKRAGALRPAKQAVPATKEDVARAVRLETDPVMRLAITLAWQGAARVDDVLTREARNVTESPDFWSVNWVGSKSDPFRLGQVTGVVLPPEEDETLRSLLRSARPGQRIFAGVTFRRVVAALKRSNQALTGHSLRRGALFRLLKMGVDLDTLQRVSRHATQDALVRYLPEAEDVPPPAFLEAIRHHGGIGDAPPSDFTPFVTVAYGGDLIVNELAAPPAQRSSEGYLAPITSSFMDLDRLLAMDTHGLLGGVLDVIRSRESLESALVRDASSWHSEAIARGTSRRMLHHLPDLLKYGVAEVAHEHPRVVLPAFTVPKKSGGERFVCDGRKLNAVMPRPPPMLLPSMPDVIDRVLSSAVVYLADAKSYFYQFELDEGVRGYFGMNLAGPRGSFVRARLRAMCMGWSWAPAIAQRASRVILPETDGLPWVDNFVIVGDSLAEAEERFTRFARRCREVNCVLNDDEGQYGIPLTQFDLLGLRFDLASSPPRYSMATAWVEKLLRSSELAVFRGGVVSPRAFYRLFGAL